MLDAKEREEVEASIPESKEDMKVGSYCLLHEDEDSKIYDLVKYVEPASVEGWYKVRIYRSWRKHNPTFIPTWTDPTDNKRMLSRSKPRGRGISPQTVPWIAEVHRDSLPVVGLQLTAVGKFTSRSLQRIPRGWKPHKP